MRCFLSGLAIIFVLGLVQPVYALSPVNVVHGEIVEVFSAQDKVRVLSDGNMNILEFAPVCMVIRRSQEVSLESARPIMPGRYQEGLFFLNEIGQVEYAIIAYQVEEDLHTEGAVLNYYDIFGEVKEVEHL